MLSPPDKNVARTGNFVADASRHVQSPSAVPAGRPHLSQPHSERFGLYLRIPALDGEQYDKARNLLEIFDGQTPVYFYLTGQKKLVLAPRTLWVMLNDPMVSELKRILGEKNVAIKE